MNNFMSPTPWSFHVDPEPMVGGLLYLCVRDANDEVIAVPCDDRLYQTNWVNFHMFAAAADMYVALKNLLPMWESGIREPWIEQARAAIAKAEGKEESDE